MSSGDKRIDDLLHEDALMNAEKITGKSYKEDEATMHLGFLMHMMKGQEKKAALKSRGDTYYTQNFYEHCALVEGYGFEMVYEETYQNDGGYPETLRYYCHREKALFYDVHTYNRPFKGDNGRDWPSAEGGSVHACVLLNGEEHLPVQNGWSPINNHLWDELGPIGMITLFGREALLHKLKKLDDSNCQFVAPWPVTLKHSLTLSHDTRDAPNPHEPDLSNGEQQVRRVVVDSKRVECSMRRLAQLPRWVRELCPTEPYDLRYVK
jgi:hypothetical protein